MDVGRPSALKNSYKSLTTKSNKQKRTGKSSKEPKLTQQSRRSGLSDLSSSESSDMELSTVWAGNVTPTPEVQLTQSQPTSHKSVFLLACPSGNQNLSVVADVHCSQGGTKSVRTAPRKPTASASDPLQIP
jgi:hypothetical protein